MTPPRALGLAGLAAVLVALAACSPGDDSGATEADPRRAPAAEEASPTDTTRRASLLERVARLDDFRGEEQAAPAGGFAHDPHGQIECSVCHADPPGHGTHDAVRCGECHGAPGAAPTDIPSSAECMACHHAESRASECTRCHDDPGGPPDVRVTQTVDVAGTADDPVRELLFRHDLHRGVSCTTCHSSGESPRFGVALECSSCHESHHRADADCLACHAPLDASVHGTEAHDGCSGATCHQDPNVLAFPLTREVCLSCHQDKTAHEPDGECARCHQVSETPVPLGRLIQRGQSPPSPAALPPARPPGVGASPIAAPRGGVAGGP